MKVAFVHTPARAGVTTGEDIAASTQLESLNRLAPDIDAIPLSNPHLRARGQVLQTMLHGGNGEYISAINASGADVVHLPKWFPWLGRDDIPRISAPSVATLHNFLPLCPVGTLYRDGKFCTDCVDRRPLPMAAHGCYRGSRLASLAAIGGRPYPARRHPFLTSVAAYVAPSPRSAEIFADLGGVPQEQLFVIPSFVPRMKVKRDGQFGDRFLFVGQLEEIKGIRELISRWPADRPLTVVGEGSQAKILTTEAAGKDVIFTGRRNPEEVRYLMANHTALLFPSRVLETQGLVVGEAASVGCPVIAIEGTAGADQVRENKMGVVVRDAAQMIEALSEIDVHFEAYSENGRAYWASSLTEEAWVKHMRGVYQAVAR